MVHASGQLKDCEIARGCFGAALSAHQRGRIRRGFNGNAPVPEMKTEMLNSNTATHLVHRGL